MLDWDLVVGSLGGSIAILVFSVGLWLALDWDLMMGDLGASIVCLVNSELVDVVACSETLLWML